jgi:hypothetical protein
MPETATYIYCLVEHARRPAMQRVPRGLPGASAPRLLHIAETLWGVTAEVPLRLYGPGRLEERLHDLSWVADTAVAHESVVEHFAARKGAAVVPMKLFTMFSNADRALVDLRSRRGRVKRILRRVRGCQEWGVRVTRRSSPSASRRAAAGRHASGTAFLAAKKRARDEARGDLLRAAEVAETVFHTLAGLARSAHRREAPQNATTPPLVDAAFLVTSETKARFRAVAGRLAAACRKSGADLTLTGPWPPYNFVQSDRES